MEVADEERQVYCVKCREEGNGAFEPVKTGSGSQSLLGGTRDTSQKVSSVVLYGRDLIGGGECRPVVGWTK